MTIKNCIIWGAFFLCYLAKGTPVNCAYYPYNSGLSETPSGFKKSYDAGSDAMESVHVDISLRKAVLPIQSDWEAKLREVCLFGFSNPIAGMASILDITSQGIGLAARNGLEYNFVKFDNLVRESFTDRMSPYTYDFFRQQVLPLTACLALELPKFFNEGVPVLHEDFNRVVSFKKIHVAALLSGAFWATVLPNGPLSVCVMLEEGSYEETISIPVSSNLSDAKQSLREFVDSNRFRGKVDALDLYTQVERAIESSKKLRFNSFNMYRGFLYDKEKLKCLLAYLCAITDIFSPFLTVNPNGNPGYFQFDSRPMNASLNERLDFSLTVAPIHLLNGPSWLHSQIPLRNIVLRPSGLIEDAQDALHVSFANMFIGGGVLGRGSLQEEIYMTTHPETLIAMLITPRLEDRQSLQVVGAEAFSSYTGYASSFRFTSAAGAVWRNPYAGVPSNSLQRVTLDSLDRRRIYVTSIDAINFSTVQNNFNGNYDEAAFLRELAKAYSGFCHIPFEDESGPKIPVSTGNWGCGMFGGDAELKAVLQWMAASLAGRDVIFFSFGNKKVSQLEVVAKKLQQRYPTVGRLYEKLLRSVDGLRNCPSVFERLLSAD